MEQAKQYLARALAWPQDGDPPAFANIHWTFIPDEGLRPGQRPPWGGRACRTLNEAVNAIEWALKKEGTRDVYVCLSTQRNAIEKRGKNGYRYFVPIRNQENAVALKTLFLDIDFKGGAHGYDTQNDAIANLARFLKETALPKPSMLVLSGGGVHVYWTLERALALAEWRPLAYALAEAAKKHSLKCDYQVTVDGARVLRVPQTWNRKLEEPRPVQLAADTGLDFSIERMWHSLEPYKTAAPAAPMFLDPAVFPPRPPLTEPSDLSAGLEKEELPPIKLDDVAKECAFVRDALATGGKDYNQSMWNLTSLISTFTEGDRADAHRMGDKHPGYTKESTDEMFDRKVREKNQKGLGWPSCASISSAGCVSCKACPHFTKGKTPLHLALGQPDVAPVPGVSGGVAPAGPQTLAVTPQVTTQAVANWDVPSGYTRLADGCIAFPTQDENGVTVFNRIAPGSMTEPWIQDKPAALVFMSQSGQDPPRQVSIELEAVNSMGMRSILQKQHFMVPFGTKGADNLSRFFMAWIDKLRSTRHSVVSAPFGWHYIGADLKGFVFDGRLWSPSGDTPATSGDAELRRQYAVVGDRQPWMEASKMVTEQKRPALDAILASAFAAPLVTFGGQPGVVLSCYSKESGVGKTTTLNVAQAVWGDPITGKQGLTDTTNSTGGKMGQLKSLPVFWDEIKGEDQTKKAVEIIFQVSGGREKARMGRSGALREPGQWKTLFITASNNSLLECVLHAINTTTAGLYRVFEFVVTKPPPGAPGQLVSADVDVMVSRLDHNHGVIGREYAQWLGANFVVIEQQMQELRRGLEKELKATKEERFWMVGVAALLLGARYANHLGFTQIDEPALKAFLVKVLNDMRNHVKIQPVDLSQEINVSNIMAQFVSVARLKHTIVTNTIHQGRGKPAKSAIAIDGHYTDVTRLDGVWMHVGTKCGMMRISRNALTDWLKSKNIAPHSVTEELKAHYKANTVQGRLAGGTTFAGITELLYEIDYRNNAPNLNFIDEA